MGKRYVTIDNLIPDMMVERGIYNRNGQALILPGNVIKAYDIQALKQRGVKGLYIHTNGPDEDDFPLKMAITEDAKASIEKHQEDDPSKLSFSSEVKDRISVGIEYLYNNIETPEMDQTAALITKEIMEAIHDNDAVAVDLNVLKASDEYTFKHSVDVATISMVVAGHLDYSEKEVYDIGIAALLHDVGKSRIPTEILNKNGKLDDDEFEIMKMHSVYGYEILKERGTYSDLICISVLQHHEKMSGNGYPYGYKNDQITPYARLITVADVYDALVTDRPYKKAYNQSDAVENIMSLTADIEGNIMKAFLSSIILYPVGAFVRLSNGEIAQVVKNYENTPLRPKVVSIESGKVYNLHEDLQYANVVITNLLDQGVNK